MITEDYVSYEVAKLLKEKGFKEITQGYINADKEIYMLPFQQGVYELGNKRYPYPTIQMAMKWLREVHKININILYDAQRFAKTDGTTEDVDVYEVDIITKNGIFYIGNYNHHESACEAAIKYCLINLI